MKTNSFKYKIKFLILKDDIIEGRQLNNYNWSDPILKFWNSSVNTRTIFLSTTKSPTSYSCESKSSILTLYHQWTATIALWKNKKAFLQHTRYWDWKNGNLNISEFDEGLTKYTYSKMPRLTKKTFNNCYFL